jgi:hypothetical protein
MNFLRNFTSEKMITYGGGAIRETSGWLNAVDLLNGVRPKNESRGEGGPRDPEQETL